MAVVQRKDGAFSREGRAGPLKPSIQKADYSRRGVREGARAVGFCCWTLGSRYRGDNNGDLSATWKLMKPSGRAGFERQCDA